MNNPPLLIDNDKQGADLLLERYKNNYKICQEHYFYYKNGEWREDTTSNQKLIKQLLYSQAMELNMVKLVRGVETAYSRNNNGATNIAKVAFQHLPIDNEFFNQIWKTTVGTITFRNGVYSFNEGKFLPDADIISPIKVQRDYKEPSQAAIQEVYDTLLNPIFDNDTEKRDQFLTWVAKALSGTQPAASSIGLLEGPTNSGRRTLVKAIEKTFGDYISEFTLKDLSKPAWLYQKQYTRLLFSDKPSMANYYTIECQTLQAALQEKKLQAQILYIYSPDTEIKSPIDLVRFPLKSMFLDLEADEEDLSDYTEIQRRRIDRYRSKYNLKQVCYEKKGSFLDREEVQDALTGSILGFFRRE